MNGDGRRGGGFRPRGGGGSGPRNSFGGGSAGGGFAPVKVGEELDVRIEAVGEKGDGIARKRGFVLFVPNTKEGEEVRIRVTKVLRKVGFAESIGPAQSTPVSEESSARPKREEYEQDAAEPIPEPEAIEDSEDFGEESEDYDSSEDLGEEDNK